MKKLLVLILALSLLLGVLVSCAEDVPPIEDLNAEASSQTSAETSAEASEKTEKEISEEKRSAETTLLFVLYAEQLFQSTLKVTDEKRSVALCRNNDDRIQPLLAQIKFQNAIGGTAGRHAYLLYILQSMPF